MRFAAVAFLAAVVPSAAFVTPFSGTVLLGMRDVGRPVLRSQCRTARPMAGPVMQVDFFSKLSRTIQEKARADIERTKALFTGLESITSDMGVIDELLSFWNLEEADVTLEKLEDALIARDFGVGTSAKICDILRERVKAGSLKDPKDLRGAMKEAIKDILVTRGGDTALLLDENKPAVLMMVGVNGGGKTTSIGKLAHKFSAEGKSVMLAAGDTFRAAADLQLEEWAKRSNATMTKSTAKSPAAVMFDAIDASLSEEVDILIADTSGRLHTNINLMKELEKVKGVFDKKMPDKMKEILLVVDATQGQNVVQQARGFNAAVGVTGIVLTKLDGTSKGGVVVSIVDELGIPIKFIGVGEKVSDLMLFDATEYVEALFPGN
mmetsp:Transcript_14727/g.21439  ORF Transcript_14727/g.21439 Transcript_14727/m.21439 type:complete len:379 (+) Transcript_14727:106-1242(+)